MLLMFLEQYNHYCFVLLFLQNDSTALHWAAQIGCNDVITFLLGCGAEVDAVNHVSYNNYYVTTIGVHYVMVILIIVTGHAKINHLSALNKIADFFIFAVSNYITVYTTTMKSLSLLQGFLLQLTELGYYVLNKRY